MRNRRLGDVEGPAHFTTAQLAPFRDGAQDAEPGSVGERFGDAYELLVVHVRGRSHIAGSQAPAGEDV